jgi:hypothetical protein
MAGYSGTPLAKKLGIGEGSTIFAERVDYASIVELPERAKLVKRLTRSVDVIHLFTKSASELASKLRRYRDTMRDDATIWVSWPKKASKVPTDITEDVIRDICLPIGLVDVKVCAVDDVWSGLKLVIRKELRS